MDDPDDPWRRPRRFLTWMVLAVLALTLLAVSSWCFDLLDYLTLPYAPSWPRST